MGKILLIVLLLAGAAILNPGVRERVEPHVQFALDPLYGWTVKSRLTEIGRAIDSELAAGRQAPRTQEELERLLTREFRTENATKDPWGTAFFLRREQFQVRVGSAGPDRIVGTEDDVLGKAFGISNR